MNRKSIKKILISTLFGLILLLLLSFATLLAVGGILSSPQYLKPWDKNYYKQFQDIRLQLAAHGLLAANNHNMQPWKIVLSPENSSVFFLYADSSRTTPEVDGDARQLMVTQGTFLEYLRVAAEKLGYEANTAIFPEGDYDEQNLNRSMDQKPVARITVKKSSTAASPLYDGIFHQDTNRGAYKDTPLTAEQMDTLEKSISNGNIHLEVFQDEQNKKIFSEYAVKGEEIETGIHRINEESAALFRPNESKKNRNRYGFSVEGQGTKGMMKYLMQGLVTLFPNLNGEKASAALTVKLTKKAAAHTPAYALLYSKDNSRASQVEAGMLYSRLVLLARTQGLVLQPLSQVLENYPEMEDVQAVFLSQYAKDGSTVQMLLRIGAPTSEYPLSMRRDVTELIEKR